MTDPNAVHRQRLRRIERDQAEAARVLRGLARAVQALRSVIDLPDDPALDMVVEDADALEMLARIQDGGRR